MGKTNAKIAFVLGIFAAFAACSDDEFNAQQVVDVAPEPRPVDAGGNEPPADAYAPADCTNYTYNGQTYNCALVDRCADNEITVLVACADCDPTYANPPGPGECPDAPQPIGDPEAAESCMSCHNGSEHNDYAGSGLSNPHPFPVQADGTPFIIKCTSCHGGNGDGGGKLQSHVPAPPSINGPTLGGMRQHLINDQKAYFNRRTLAGIDKLEAEYSYPERPGETFTAIDYLQFINPGDLRVVSLTKGCGEAGCHDSQHGQWVPRSVIATSTGIFSATRFSVGVDNRIPEYRAGDLPAEIAATDGDSLADSSPRAVENPGYQIAVREVGEVGRLVEQPEYAQYDPAGYFWENPAINAANLVNDIYQEGQAAPSKTNTVRSGSDLEKLIDEQINITCGDCHLYSAGQNDRYADFRSSGCTSCHMEYSYDGRSRSGDPNVDRNEPANPDAIAAPERSHVESHQIRNVARVLPNGGFVRGISDRACVGCHQGSNRTVLQFWGIRLDQNEDVTADEPTQYPANPVNFTNTAQDTRLYNPGVGNQTFNGRNPNQYLLTEDYDGDGRDDTPPDVHYAAGMGCIDCHGSRDMHGGKNGDVTSGKIKSRQDQATSITCEACHGGVEAYASTAPCKTYDGVDAECAVDAKGNPMGHVTMDPQGHFWLKSRVDGQRHYVIQTRDVTVNTNRSHPINAQLLYNPKASYAMGRNDGNDAATGIGPKQENQQGRLANFSHMDTMDCASCHASWTNNCIGCHLATEYNQNPNDYFFSNITGERILLDQNAADFVYQSPVMTYLGVNSRGKITQVSPAEKVFWLYVDLNGDASDVYAFSDRLGEGNNPNYAGRNAFPALSQNQMAPHSIRGKVSPTEEGPRYCVTCHITQAAVENFGDEYTAFRDAYQNNNFANINFNILQEHIGQNPGNQLNSPFFPHMVAGLGSALFLFDENGCPVNPLDNRADRQYCQNGAPADNFNVNDVKYDLDRLVEYTGIRNSSTTHPMLEGGFPAGRGEAANALMAGPLRGGTISLLTDPEIGLVLDSWINADGIPEGGAPNFLNQ